MPKTRKRLPVAADPLISRIEVEKLFYTYTYNLEMTSTASSESGRLMLLYGSNGSGKTTILNLLYHLLHPEPYGGHRSFLGSIPFKRFRLHLVGGIVVTAERSSKYDPGPYDVTVESRKEEDELGWTWEPGRNRRDNPDPAYDAFCGFLSQLDFSLHYLRDTRRVEASHITAEARKKEASEHLLLDDIITVSSAAEREPPTPDIQLKNSVDAVMLWFQQRALSDSNVGYASVNTIYRDIIKRIVRTGTSDQETLSFDDLTRTLIELKEKNSAFARFGLTPELDINSIVTNLKSAKPRHLPMLNTVLGPFLEGHAARLQALEELQRVMSSFVSLLGKFYSHKNASVHLSQGLKITTETGQELNPSQLSSGEKQLLLLFCNAISSRRDKTVLMIDEPEISLNVRWQRELIPALLTCMAGTSFQLILATHSVELLARYRDCVTSLDNMQEVKSND